MVFAGAGSQVGDGALDPGEGEAVDVADDGDDQAAAAADGDSEVVALFVDDRFAADFGVQSWKLLEGFDAGFGEEGHEAELDTVLGGELILEAGSQGDYVRQVDFVEGRQD